MRILITGSREWMNVDLIRTIFEGTKFNSAATTLVSGHCRGADLLCERIAKELGWMIEPHEADWELFGKRAGYIRNVHMVSLGADICLAFIKDHSKGSTNTAYLSRTANIQTYIFRE